MPLLFECNKVNGYKFYVPMCLSTVAKITGYLHYRSHTVGKGPFQQGPSFQEYSGSVIECLT